MLLTQCIVGLLVVILVILLCVVALVLRKMLWRDAISLLSTDSHARVHGIEIAGYFFGCLVIAASAVSAVSISDQTVSSAILAGQLNYLDFFGTVLIYGLAAVLCYAVVGRLSLRYLLHIDVQKGIEADNAAVSLVAGASSIAHSLVIAAAISGETESASVAPPLVFFAVGILCLWLCILGFRRLTRYDDNSELVHGNLAAALSYGGLMIAISMIVAHAVEGDFVNYAESFQLFAKSMMPIVLLYPIRQIVVQSVMLRQPLRWYGGHLDDEIEHNRNVGAGAIEAATYIAAAYLICCVSS